MSRTICNHLGDRGRKGGSRISEMAISFPSHCHKGMGGQDIDRFAGVASLRASQPIAQSQQLLNVALADQDDVIPLKRLAKRGLNMASTSGCRQAAPHSG